MRYLIAIAEQFVSPAPSATPGPDAREIAPLRSLQAPGAWRSWWNSPVGEPSVAGAHRARQVGVRGRLVPRH